ncbi:putative sulfate exporter family transporter [Haloechinothrix sp. YIM 98757]|uniref:Putative sulfate exporter family transporter n=1 Tax=Haloechinothrix aidingensis TaxID=2752311 RepID=A0A838AF95_9PSEU|nr:putative sulfate exporter family transporter [Haloechinothrix aidingensis]MBA0127825.1 putative sulfate exporter family transporter [Haloechinothrix aidingensis]
MSVTQRNVQRATTGSSRVLLAGLITACGAGLAYLVNLAVPAVGTLTAAVLLGVLAGNVPVLPPSTRPALQHTTRWLLRSGIVLLGLQLAVSQLLELGPGTVLAVLLTVAVGFLGTVALGRALGVGRGLSVLVATGFSICGASAIAAMEGVVRRRDEDVATAIALVTLYGTLAIAAIPLAGPAVGLTGDRLGEWAGVSVHEVGQVVAAAAPAGAGAVAAAIVVKLSRVVLLAPLVAGVSLTERRALAGTGGTRPPVLPLFVIGFLVMVAVRSTGMVPGPALAAAEVLTEIALAGALFGLGTSVELRALVRTGPRALLLGLLSTLLIAGTGGALLRLLA